MFAVNIFNRQHLRHVKVLFQLSRTRLRVAKLVRGEHSLPVLKAEPRTMKIDSPQFSALFTPELTALAALFQRYGHEIRIAGGAVRDLLVDIQPHDLDFATTATPDQMKEMFEKEEVRMINAKGEKHGTITPRINDKQNFEVTTLRIDVVTDGRHAEVEFTRDWQLDANRRDLTVNSMFLGLDGTVYDYFNGYEDLLNRRICFVGDPISRIQEDYLRILRYFRFHGRIAGSESGHDQATLEAISENAHGLEQVSGERVWSEFGKILGGASAGDLVELMVELGVGKHIGLPEAPDMAGFRSAWQRCRSLSPHPITVLSGLLRHQDDSARFHARVKLSAFERDLCTYLLSQRDAQSHGIKDYQVSVMLATGKGKLSDVKRWAVELCKFRGDAELADRMSEWELPRFPVSGHRLRDAGVPGGKAMGPVLQKLREYWAENDFKPSEEDILEELPSVLAELGISRPNKDR